MILELLREGMARRLGFDAALEAAAVQCAFTTHTPVAAGHDVFSDELFSACFGDFARSLGVPLESVAALGRAPGAAYGFNMTRLALTGARHINGVSRIHGAVSAQLCADHWGDVPAQENPVGYVTNGVHVPTFLAQTWCWFFDSHIGSDWRERLSDTSYWQALDSVPDQLFWEVAQDTKSRMLAGVRHRLQREYERKGLSEAQLRRITRLLDPEHPDVLTLGFARRFATYKRAALLLRDRARLARLIGPDRPVLFLFAGKAHPADQPGQDVLREIKELMLTPEFGGNVIFLEDYDMQLARWLVSGVDVWLNNPIAPLEASGTSGIKAAVNGRLNLSVLDGWWAEACDGANGWGIPPANVQDPQRRDTLDAELILETLEREVIPLYYARQGAGYSPEWVQRCKHAMMTVIPQFNMRRVVRDYARNMYWPAAATHSSLIAGGDSAVSEFTQWKRKIREAWPRVALRRLTQPPRELVSGARVQLRVAVALNGLRPGDLKLEFLAQRLLPRSDMESPALASIPSAERDGLWRELLQPTGEIDSDGSVVYMLDATPPTAGQYSTEIRARPWNPLLSHPMEMGLLKRL